MKQHFQKLSVLAALLVLWTGMTGSAEVIDRIAAQVDDEIILLSEIDETVFLLISRGQLAVRDSSELDAARRQILDKLVEDKLIIHRAQALGLKVSDGELSAQVEEAILEIRENFADERTFQEALETEGVTLNMLRERYTKEFRNERLRQMVLGNEIRDKAEVTTEDVQSYYQETKADLPKRADEMHLRHMLFNLADSDQETAAQKKAQALLDVLEGGTAFGVAAEGYQAVTTPQRFCEGDLDPAMEEALGFMSPGENGGPVRGPGGYTVLQMTSRDGDCYELVYVIVPLEADPESKEAARAKAEAAWQRVSGGEVFGEVAQEVSEDQANKESGGDMGFVTMDGVPQEIADMLVELELQAISPVVEAPDGFHIFQVLERRAGGEYTLDEIQQQLRQYLENQKYQEAYSEWLAAVRDSSYIEIKAWNR